MQDLSGSKHYSPTYYYSSSGRGALLTWLAEALHVNRVAQRLACGAAQSTTALIILMGLVGVGELIDGGF